MKESKHRKQITFDLSQKALAKHYPKPADSINPQFYKKAYGDIAYFMEHNGFEHRQFSVYTSKEKLMIADVNLLIEQLGQKLPWLAASINQLDVTDIGRQHSLIETLQEATISHQEELEHEQHSRTVAQDELGMAAIMAKLNPVEKKQEHTVEQEFEY